MSDWKAAQLVQACAAAAGLALAPATTATGLRRPSPARAGASDQQREISPAPPSGVQSDEELTLALLPTAGGGELPPGVALTPAPSSPPPPTAAAPERRSPSPAGAAVKGGGSIPTPASVLEASPTLSGASTPVVTGNASLDEPAAPLPLPAAAVVTVRKVLIGHSLGGICAALAALERPGEVEALVLVAPAILAMAGRDGGVSGAELRALPTGPGSEWPVQQQQQREKEGGGAGGRALARLHSHPILLDDGQVGRRDAAAAEGEERQAEEGEDGEALVEEEDGGGGDRPVAQLALPWGLVDRYVCVEVGREGDVEEEEEQERGSARRRGVSPAGRLFAGVAAALRVALAVAALALLRLLRPAVVALLRALVRSRPFWLRGLQSAYYNPGLVTDQVRRLRARVPQRQSRTDARDAAVRPGPLDTPTAVAACVRVCVELYIWWSHLWQADDHITNRISAHAARVRCLTRRDRHTGTPSHPNAHMCVCVCRAQVIDAYSLPQLVRGWEAGMFMFLAARVASSLPPRALGLAAWLAGFSATTSKQRGAASSSAAAADEGGALASAAELEVATASAASAEGAAEGLSLASRCVASHADLAHRASRGQRSVIAWRLSCAAYAVARRLAELCRRTGLPVLIIHGVHDALVPASNSRRLAAMLPGCELALLQRCGHMPQEEWPQPFVELVREFAQRRGASATAARGGAAVGKALRLVPVAAAGSP